MLRSRCQPEPVQRGPGFPRRSRLAVASLVLCSTLSVMPRARADDLLQPPRLLHGPPAKVEVTGSPEFDLPTEVLATVTVDALGAVTRVELPEGLPQAVANAASATLAGWRFLPATRNGSPVAARVRVRLRLLGSTSNPAQGQPPQAGPSPAAGDDAASSLAGSDGRAGSKTRDRTTSESWSPGEAVPADMVISGARRPRSASEVIRERDVLEASPHRSGSDLLGLMPGVFLSQHGGEGKAHQIFLRGFDAVHGQDLELWAAGAPINDVSNVHGQGYADLHFLIPETVQQLRAMPGTYDPRQGDFAVAGSAEFSLGVEQEGLHASQSFGSFGGTRTLLMFRPEGQSPASFGAFESWHTDGWGPSRAADRTSTIAQLELPVGGGTRLRVMGSAYASRFASPGTVPLDDLETGRRSPRDAAIPGQGGASGREQLVLEWTGRDDRANAWMLSPYLVRRTLSLRQNFTGWLTDPVNGDMTQQRNDALTIGCRASYRRRTHLVSERDGVEVGISARTDTVEQSQRSIAVATGHVTGTTVDAVVHQSDVAGYVDVSLFPVERVALRGGVRADGIATTVDDAAGQSGVATRSAHGVHLGKKGTIDVAIGESGVHVLASYGEGFRSPQARSLGDGERTPFTTVQSYEAGTRYQDANRVAASLAVFHTLLSRDLLFDHATGRNESVPGTARTGIAADMTAHPAKWLLTVASFTWAKATYRWSEGIYEKGYSLPYAPQIVGRTELAATQRLAVVAGQSLEGKIGLGWMLLAGRPMPYGEMGHDSLQVDARASLRWGPTELGLAVFNVFDSVWFDGEYTYASRFDRSSTASLVPQRHVTTGSPRTVWASVAIHL